MRADDWGNLKGRFVYDGKAPVPAAIDTAGKRWVTAKGLVHEDLVVKPDGSFANVAVYALGKVQVHPDYKKSDSAAVVLDAKEARFEPHLLGMRSRTDITN